MAYDWDGHRTKRIQAMKLAVALALGLMIPLAAAAFSYVS